MPTTVQLRQLLLTLIYIEPLSVIAVMTGDMIGPDKVYPDIST